MIPRFLFAFIVQEKHDDHKLLETSPDHKVNFIPVFHSGFRFKVSPFKAEAYVGLGSPNFERGGGLSDFDICDVMWTRFFLT